VVGAGVDVESVAVRLCAGGDVGAAVGATHPRRPGVPLGGRRNGAGQLGALRRRHGRGINNLFRQVLEVARKLGLGGWDMWPSIRPGCEERRREIGAGYRNEVAAGTSAAADPAVASGV
jgi:hypothetical protein